MTIAAPIAKGINIIPSNSSICGLLIIIELGISLYTYIAIDTQDNTNSTIPRVLALFH